ncbi:hypothetical protein GIB67_014796 [Kingdonia uniflora]|uniref:Uncharacterized protein n=1 Tax=Kingdonia uniflora TaxID=39325 RepID=A0A7J7NUY5_9MAGN|nr:hypothetical protein GIB67_014796 [Kingdonia uniflora]
MVKLCEDDPDEASKEIKRHIFQVNVKLKTFIEDKGYDPDTLEPFPVFPELVDGGDLQMKEGEAYDVVEAAGSTGGGVRTSAIGTASGGTVDGLVVEGSTEAAEGAGAGGPVEEEGVTTPI